MLHVVGLLSRLFSCNKVCENLTLQTCQLNSSANKAIKLEFKVKLKTELRYLDNLICTQ